jgi:hypothetical protein
MAGERVRDKIAASRKRGIWMGGMPALGYDVVERKLVANPQDWPSSKRCSPALPRRHRCPPP